MKITLKIFSVVLVLSALGACSLEPPPRRGSGNLYWKDLGRSLVPEGMARAGEAASLISPVLKEALLPGLLDSARAGAPDRRVLGNLLNSLHGDKMKRLLKVLNDEPDYLGSGGGYHPDLYERHLRSPLLKARLGHLEFLATASMADLKQSGKWAAAYVALLRELLGNMAAPPEDNLALRIDHISELREGEGRYGNGLTLDHIIQMFAATYPYVVGVEAVDESTHAELASAMLRLLRYEHLTRLQYPVNNIRLHTLTAIMCGASAFKYLPECRALAWDAWQDWVWLLRSRFYQRGYLSEPGSYHLVDAHLLAAAFDAARKLGFGIPADVARTLPEVIRFQQALCRPDGSVPQFGESWRFADHEPHYYVPFWLWHAAWAAKDPSALAGAAKKPDPFTLLLLGAEGYDYLVKAGGDKPLPAEGIRPDPATGHAVVADVDSWLCLRAAVGVNHEHADLLTIDLFGFGRPLLGDNCLSGYGQDRFQWVETQFHATITPSDRSYWKNYHRSSWPDSDDLLPGKVSLEVETPGGPSERILAGHTYYPDLSLSREVRKVRGGFLILDKMDGPGEEPLVARFPFFSPGEDFVLDEQNARAWSVHVPGAALFPNGEKIPEPRLNGPLFDFWNRASDPPNPRDGNLLVVWLKARAIPSKTSITSWLCSPDKIELPTLVLERVGKGPMVTLLVPFQGTTPPQAWLVFRDGKWEAFIQK